MYIDRKWDIPEINISLNFYQESDPELTTTISRSIRFPTEIEDDLKAIINYCRKVSGETTKNNIIINTTVIMSAKDETNSKVSLCSNLENHLSTKLCLQRLKE
jgi:hypothetical protein